MTVLTILEFHQGVKKDKTFYQDMKDDKDIIEWNENVVATPQMACTHSILSEFYFPTDVREKLCSIKYSGCTLFYTVPDGYRENIKSNYSVMNQFDSETGTTGMLYAQL
jgi:hypothetical protein